MPDVPLDSDTRLLSATAGVATEVPPTRGQKIKAAAVSVFGFVMFYLLSAGPMAGLHRILDVPGFQRAVEVVYAPVVFVVKRNVEPFSSVMKWYIDLFR